MRNYKALIVWQKGIDFFMYSHRLIKKMPREERYETGSQLRRSALSIPSNIAEGSAYTSTAQYKLFLERSLGSAFEAGTVLIAIDKSYPDIYEDELKNLFSLIEEIEKMLMSFIDKLK